MDFATKCILIRGLLAWLNLLAPKIGITSTSKVTLDCTTRGRAPPFLRLDLDRYPIERKSFFWTSSEISQLLYVIFARTEKKSNRQSPEVCPSCVFYFQHNPFARQLPRIPRLSGTGQISITFFDTRLRDYCNCLSDRISRALRLKLS